MLCHMKVTLNLDDTIMQRLREEAALPLLPSWHGGGELVDISNRDELYRVMEELCEFPSEDKSLSPST